MLSGLWSCLAWAVFSITAYTSPLQHVLEQVVVSSLKTEDLMVAAAQGSDWFRTSSFLEWVGMSS